MLHNPPPQHNLPFEYEVANIDVVPTPVVFRPIEEDMSIMKSIFLHEEYRLQIENFRPRLILDCGGNIGCAAVYFANKYPAAQIYSIEPERDNFTLLRYNTAFYDNIHPIKSALWDKETFIRVEDRGFGKWGFMTFETTAADPAAIKTATVGRLLADSGFDEIDLLKVDIEGAEKEIFSAPDVDDWLSKVNVLTIELHDHMKRGCSYAFFKAISKYNWFFAFRGENLIFIRENFIN